MDKEKINLQYETKSLDVTEQGIVTVAVNGIGVEDSQHDISMPGSFDETLKRDIHKMRWFLNHDPRQLLGVPLSGEEKDGNLIMTGQLNLSKQIGRDILEDYKLYNSAGRTLEHSIGVRAIERDKADARRVYKWQMHEYSTLTGWGANPQTFLVGIKSANANQVQEAVDFIRQAFKQRGYSDERLKGYEEELNLLLKALAGEVVVTCPSCGHQFDYGQEQEHTFSSEVQDAAREFLSSLTNEEARRQISEYSNEIRSEVASIIDGMVGSQREISEKGITDVLSYVRCPHCWSRVYRKNALLVEESKEESTDKQHEESQIEEKSHEPATSFWASLTAINKK